MEPFRIHILGCGSALPTLQHNATSQVVEVRGKFFMIDCGEGTQMQLRRTHIHFSKLQAVFISHLHGDHCFGLPGLLSTFGMLGRTSKLKVFAPAVYQDLFARQMEFFMSGLGYEVEFVGIDTTQTKVIFEDHSLSVSTIPLQHRVPCCGFLFREKPTLPHIRRDMIDYYGIPVSQINNIKNGAGWTTADGVDVPHDRLVEPADAARSYAYCSDTRYVPALADVVKGVDMLYHESTYTSENEDRARLYSHSTARQAATIALKAGVGQLLLGHYSARYNDEQVLLREAQEVFPQSFLTGEGKVFDVCSPAAK